VNTHPAIAVIGGGAAGLMAAITAARMGALVTVFERQDRVGKKLLVTGNGRCNITNSAGFDITHYHTQNRAFVKSVLGGFTVDDTRKFFHDIGLVTRVEDGGRVFPVTGQASNVLDVLRFEAERTGVTVQTKSEVSSIKRVFGRIALNVNRHEVHFDRVIVACGGKPFPHLSGTGLGLEILEKTGHRLCHTFPALVPLKTDLRYNRQLKGLKTEASVRLEIDGAVCAIDNGEVLFTDYGLSGPPVIQMSYFVNLALFKKQSAAIILDLFPDFSGQELSAEITRRVARLPDVPVDEAMIGLLHKRLILPVLSEAGFSNIRKTCREVPEPEINALTALIKNWRIPVTGSLSWNDAQVMAGGINTDDFNPSTLESRIIPGLWAAGEVLDVTGDCGGYNLQWAWSSGFVAAKEAACHV
jgi:predicted Rossmann fold flavoprotein